MKHIKKYAVIASAAFVALQSSPALACPPVPSQVQYPIVSYVGSVTAAQNVFLHAGSYITSPNGVYKLIFQDDGNLVLYKNGTTTAVWDTNTEICGSAGPNVYMPYAARFQSDGNLVVYHANVSTPLTGFAVWDVNTQGNPNATLKVQDDGNVVIYNGTKAIWARTW